MKVYETMPKNSKKTIQNTYGNQHGTINHVRLKGVFFAVVTVPDVNSCRPNLQEP